MTIDEMAKELSYRKPMRIHAAENTEAAVAVLIVEEKSGPELFFIRRAEDPRDPWSGQIGLPGGWREKEDASALATAVRETFEETLIELREDQLIAELDTLAPKHPGLPAVVIRPFLFVLPKKPAVTPSVEVAGYFWLKAQELKSSEGRAVVTGRGSTFDADAYNTANAVIWGITRRIIRPIVSQLGA